MAPALTCALLTLPIATPAVVAITPATYARARVRVRGHNLTTPDRALHDQQNTPVDMAANKHRFD